jgi:hypothetical protein
MKKQAVESQNHEAAADAGWMLALQSSSCGPFMTVGVSFKNCFI